jgi:hypothetical protein
MLTQSENECSVDEGEIFLSSAETKIWLGVTAGELAALVSDGSLPARTLSPRLLPCFAATDVARLAKTRPKGRTRK